MKMKLEFASRSPWRKTTLVLLLIGVACSGYALTTRHKLLEGRSALVAQLDARQRAVDRTRPVQLSPVRKEAVEETQRLVSGLQRPWEPMLNALQVSVRNDVVVNRVQPETDAFRLRISGQADSSQAFVEFVQRLRADASWRTVEPLSEAKQPDNAVTGGKPVVFQLVAEWNQP